jgi:para-aminobenzoate synthetase/4-amino-4-deoxychorismate lyase
LVRLSAAPERFLQGDVGGRVEPRPIKGTRPRGATATEDQNLAQALLTSAKDRSENLMIVDLLRNDLSRACVPGSVQVPMLCGLESFPAVHHLVSVVTGQLRADMTALDLLRGAFPGGSVTGAPKIRAMELLGAVERDARGPYCGAIGRIDSDGNAAFNVAIRTLRLTPVENGQGSAVLGIGSAIVADSDALSERRECEVKAGFVRRASPGYAAPAFDLIETMRFAPDSGIALLELHLARMKRSAEILGFAFDRHAVRNQIQALCFELDAPARLRLLVARSGASALEAAPLPAPLPAPLDEPIKVAALPHPIDPGDWRLTHKTSDRGFYDDALAAAHSIGAAEAVLVRDDGLVTEGSFTNLFVDGPDGALLTPPASLGLLPGVLREHLIADGRAREAQLTLDDLQHGFWLGNGLRGLMRATLI